MAGLALSTIGVIFGWGTGSSDGKTAPTTWTQIEECVSIGGVSLTKEQLDSTPLESKKKKYTAGHEDTGGELTTTFNMSNTFVTQYEAMLTAQDSLADGSAIWFCAYHPNLTKMNVYIVTAGDIPSPEYSVGNVLQVEINHVLVDFPDPITAVKPTAPTA